MELHCAKEAARAQIMGTTKRRKTATGSAKRKKAPPTTRLLNSEERKQLVNRVEKDEVLMHVQKIVPSHLVSDLFPERELYWKSLLPDKLKSLVYTGVSKYLQLYEECGKGRDRNSTLYLKWLDYERSLVCKSLQSVESGSEVDVGDVNVSEDTRRSCDTDNEYCLQQSSTADGKGN